MGYFKKVSERVKQAVSNGAVSSALLTGGLTSATSVAGALVGGSTAKAANKLSNTISSGVGGAITGAGQSIMPKDEMSNNSADINAAPTDPAAPNPYLEEELANSRKKGRASTILGGASDTTSGSSARSLLGML